MLTRLRLGFRHLRGNKFRHSFKDTLHAFDPVVIKLKP